MTNLEKLFNELYVSGFEKGNIEDARLALRMASRLYKEKSLGKEHVEVFKSEVGKKLLSMTPYGLVTLKSSEEFKGLMKEFYEADNFENNNLSKDTLSYYEDLAKKRKIISENEHISDFNDEALLNEFDKNGNKVNKKNQENENLFPEMKIYKAEVNKENNDKVIPNASIEVRNEKMDVLEKVLREGMNYNGKEDTPEEIRFAIEKRNMANKARKGFFFVYFGNEADPFAKVKEFYPVTKDEKYLESVRINTCSMMQNVAKTIVKDQKLTAGITKMMEEKKPVNDVITYMANEINKRADAKEVIAKLNENGFFDSILNRFYDSFKDKKMNEQVFGKLKKIPGIEKMIPEDYDVSVFDHPEIANIYQREEDLKELGKDLPEDSPMQEVLKDANDILAIGDRNYVGLTSDVAEKACSVSDRKRSAKGAEYLKKEYQDIDVKQNLSTIYINKPEDLSKVMKGFKDNDFQFEDNYKKEIKSILHEMMDAGMFDLTKFNYEAEEGDPKTYGFKALSYARFEVETALNEKDKNALATAVQNYRQLEAKYDHIIAKLEKMFPEDGEYTSNVSVSRNRYLPSKYRSNYKGATLLSALYHTLGFCHESGLSIDEVVDHPVNSLINGLNNYHHDTEFMKIFNDKNLSKEEIIVKLYNSHAKIQSTSMNVTIKGRSAFRGGVGLTMLYNGKNKQEIEAGLNTITDAYFSYLGEMDLKNVEFFGKNGYKTVANMLFAKEKDWDPIVLNADGTKKIDPETMEMKEPMKLNKYINANYNFDQLAEKLKEVHDVFQKGEINNDSVKVIGYISESIQYVDHLDSFERAALRNVLTSGHDPYIDLRNEKNHPEADKGLMDFSLKLSNIAKEIMGNGKSDNVLEKHEKFIKRFYGPRRIDFYCKALKAEFSSQGVEIVKLGYLDNTQGVLNALHDALNGKEEFKNVKIKEGLFDSLTEDSYKQFDKGIDVPKEMFKKDFMKAKAVRDSFKGVSQEDASEGFMKMEDYFATETGLAYDKALAEKLMKENEELKDVFHLTAYTADVNPYANQKYSSKIVSRYNEFKVSVKTKEAILSVYHKMKDYGMLYAFDKKGEETHKCYAFHKFQDAKEKVLHALDEKDLDAAYEASKAYEPIMNEYRDVMDTCKKMFPQDGKHIPDNLSCSRENYLPREFSERQQEQIQMNAVYEIASFAEKHNMSVEELLDHSDDLLKLSSKEMAGQIQSEVLGKDKKYSLAFALNQGILDLDYTDNRAFEALNLLETDDKVHLRNSEIFMTYVGLKGAINLIYPFMKLDKDRQPTEVDYDLMKQYIASGGRSSITNFLVNQVNQETGKNYENHFDYDKAILDDHRAPEEVLDEVIRHLAEGVMDINGNRKIETGYGADYDSMYVAAAMYMKDYLDAKDLVADDSLGVKAIKYFIANPLGNVKRYISDNYKNVEMKYIRFFNGNDVKEKDVRKALEDNNVRDDYAYQTMESEKVFVADKNVRELEQEFSRVKNKKGAAYDSRNITKLLVIARRANQLYQSRGTFAHFFSGEARKENALESKIHNYCRKMGVNDSEYASILSAEDNDSHLIMTSSSGVSLMERIVALSPDKVKASLNKIFEKGSLNDLSMEQKNAYLKKTNLTIEEINYKKEAEKILSGKSLDKNNFDKVMNLYKDTKALKNINGVDEETKKIIDKSYKMVKKELISKGFFEDYLALYEQGEIEKTEIIQTIQANTEARLLAEAPKKVEIPEADIEFEENGMLMKPDKEKLNELEDELKNKEEDLMK